MREYKRKELEHRQDTEHINDKDPGMNFKDSYYSTKNHLIA